MTFHSFPIQTSSLGSILENNFNTNNSNNNNNNSNKIEFLLNINDFNNDYNFNSNPFSKFCFYGATLTCIPSFPNNSQELINLELPNTHKKVILFGGFDANSKQLSNKIFNFGKNPFFYYFNLKTLIINIFF